MTARFTYRRTQTVLGAGYDVYRTTDTRDVLLGSVVRSGSSVWVVLDVDRAQPLVGWSYGTRAQAADALNADSRESATTSAMIEDALSTYPQPAAPEDGEPHPLTADPAVVAAAERVKREVIDDVRSGIVPATVADFSDLHSYVDANMYGGEDADALWDEFTEHDGERDPYMRLNAMQDVVDAWIKSGGLRDAVAVSGEPAEPVAAPTRRVLGSDLVDGAVVYVCGRWQVLTDLRPDGAEHFRFSTADGHGLARSGSRYDVRVCPACGQQISVTEDGFTTECGGQGEGGCGALIDGDHAVQDAHCLVLDLVADGGR